MSFAVHHTRRFAALLGLLLSIHPINAADEPKPTPRTLIDFTDRAAVRARRPLVIAHRGGVVAVDSPECSLTALRRAAAAGYDMVELDVRQSRDGVPMLFHDETLLRACGVNRELSDLTAAELSAIHYRASGEPIATLDAALSLCRSSRLGVMLDIKRADGACLDRVAGLVNQHGLTKSTVTINGMPLVARHLRKVSLLRSSNVDEALAKSGDRPLAGTFWFGLPEDLPSERVAELQKAGALVIPAINMFRFPAGKHRELAAAAIKRLQAAGVDGFQIDSTYRDLIEK